MRPALAAVLASALAAVAGLSGCVQVQVGGPAPAAEPDGPGASIAFGPAAPKAGQAVAFRATVRSAADGDSLRSVLWSFGDGGTASGLETTHAFRAAGTYVVRIAAETALSGRLTASKEVVVSAAAARPTPAPDAGGSPAFRPPALAPPAIAVEVDRNVARFSFTLGGIEADQVAWEFGDGAWSNESAPAHAYLAKGSFGVTLRVAAGAFIGENTTVVTISEVPFQPHVIVGVPDSGVNVYHEVYRRPERTMHPCTYIEGYPCDVPALNLSLGAPSYAAALELDRATWAAVKPGDRYWIPGTNIVGALCSQPYLGSNAATAADQAIAEEPDYCILGDSSSHGTGTSSSVLSENPDALLVVVEGNAGGADMLAESGLPLDVISYSWGAPVPLFLPLLQSDHGPFFVAASGNEGAFPVVLDSEKAHPSVITVGGADGASRTEPGYSGFKTMEFVSEYCRPAAQAGALDGEDGYCGTSFAAPTFAGALSRVILEVRLQSGYTGTVKGGVVDPLLGVTKWDVRDALNRTASYEPDSPFPEDPELVNLVEDAPFYQWGWGYVARNEVPDVLACLLDGNCPDKDAATVAYMQALWTYRTATSMA